MIKITIEPRDLSVLYPFFFTASLEGKSKNETFNRVFIELDKEIRKQYGVAYLNYVGNLRKAAEKLKKTKS